MNVITRGIRNAFRNSIRTFSIVVILGLSVGLALSMVVARQAVEQKIASVKSSVGNTVSIAPAGIQGFQGGGTPLTTDQLHGVVTIPHVTNVTETLNDRLTTDNTNLVSAINAGSFGNRQAGNSGVGFQFAPGGGQRGDDNGATPQFTRTFTPPIVVTGSNNLSETTSFGGDKVTFSSGKAIDPSSDTNVADVGQALATKNNLHVGSTFTAYGATITVAGIYKTGNTFSDAGLVVSLPALERLSAQPKAVTTATATVDSIDNMDSVVAAVKKALGSTADVTNDQTTAQAIVQPLENVKSISVFSLIGALVAGAVIILLTMTMIVRERRREIGVMKAIGSSNLKTVIQFVSEAITLTVLGMVVGLIIGAVAATPITKVLVTNNSNSSSVSSLQPGIGGGGFRRATGGRGLRGLGSNGITNIRDIQASVGWNIVGYGVGSALVIAIVGSAVPALFISKIRPAEVMRVE